MVLGLRGVSIPSFLLTTVVLVTLLSFASILPGRSANGFKSGHINPKPYNLACLLPTRLAGDRPQHPPFRLA